MLGRDALAGAGPLSNGRIGTGVRRRVPPAASIMSCTGVVRPGRHVCEFSSRCFTALLIAPVQFDVVRGGVHCDGGRLGQIGAGASAERSSGGSSRCRQRSSHRRGVAMPPKFAAMRLDDGRDEPDLVQRIVREHRRSHGQTGREAASRHKYSQSDASMLSVTWAVGKPRAASWTMPSSMGRRSG